jgi:dTDP-4-amino-4,6-dideoxygalactose transaminase
MDSIAIGRPSRLAPTAAGGARRWSYRVAAEVPCWNARTYRALLRTVSFGKVISGRDTEILAGRLRERFRQEVVVSGNGRSAITLALTSAAIRDGDEVIVPTFCCESILHPIFAVGARPVFADVGRTLMLTADTVDGACTPRTRAVIVPHMFGNAAPIAEIAQLARRRGLLLIDDAAQALGGTVNGRPLGTFGDAGVVSFGNGKICFGTGGGALVSGDSDLIRRARTITLHRPRASAAILHATGIMVWRRWRRHTLRLLNALSGRGMIRRSSPSPWGAARNIDAAVALTLLDTLDWNVEQRRARVSLYEQRLTGLESVSTIPHAAGSACLTQVVRVSAANPSTRARHILDTLRDAGVEAVSSFTPLHTMTRYRELAVRPLPQADALIGCLFELAAEPQIPLTEIERIADLVIRAAV